jgi:hypothetical protein
MNRESLVELVYERTELDANVIDDLTENQMRDILGLNNPEPDAPPRERKRRPIHARAVVPKLLSFEFAEYRGALVRMETFNNGDVVRVHCGDRVQWRGRTVSAGIVLHWLRTGETVARVPRKPKPFRAVVRVGGKVKHLGRFATEAERDAARFAFRLGV